MPRIYIAKNKKQHIGNDIIIDAIAEIRGGSSIRKAAKSIGISESALRKRLKKPSDKTFGGQTSLPYDSEEEIASLLTLKYKWGFTSTRAEIRSFVHDYVKTNKPNETPIGEHLRKYCRFDVCLLFIFVLYFSLY